MQNVNPNLQIAEDQQEALRLRQLHPRRPLPRLCRLARERKVLPHELLRGVQDRQDRRGRHFQRGLCQVQPEADLEDLSQWEEAGLVQFAARHLLERGLSDR